MKVSVSYLGCKNIPKTIIELDKTDVDFIHVDVMDGKYVKKKTMSFSDLSSINHYTQKRLDVHFMVRKPLKYIDDYALLNVFCMSFHLDIKDNLDKVIERTKMYGIKVGLVLNPDDEVEKIYPYLDKIDMVLVMTVTPGASGQEMIMSVLPKIKELRKKFTEEKRDILISVDGGVNLENKHWLKDVDIITSGSCITKSDNYQKTITELRDVD